MSLLPLYSAGAFGSTATDSLAIALDLDRSPFGKTTERVTTAVRRLTGLIDPSETALDPLEFHDYAKDCYERIRADGSAEELLSFLAYVSTFFHEVRHAHDLMGTYYGQELLFIGANCAQNVGVLVAGLEEWQAGENGRSIPLPLQMTDEPVRENGELLRLFTFHERMAAEVAGFDRPALGSPAELTVTHLLEASAIFVQLGFIQDVFGDDASYRLVEYIQTGSKASLYLQIREELVYEFSRLGRGGFGWDRIINCLLWCCLNRPSFADKPYSEAPNTVIVYEALAEEVASAVDEPDLGRVWEVIDRFCRSWGLTTPREAVEKRNRHLSGRLERLRRAAAAANAPDAEFPQIYQSYVTAYAGLAERILERPEEYFSVQSYVAQVVLGLMAEVFVLLKWRGESYEYRFGSPQMLDVEKWEAAVRRAAAFRIIVNGRGSVRPSFVEESAWEELTQEPSRTIRFRDRFFAPAGEA